MPFYNTEIRFKDGQMKSYRVNNGFDHFLTSMPHDLALNNKIVSFGYQSTNIQIDLEKDHAEIAGRIYKAGEHDQFYADLKTFLGVEI